MPTVTSSQLSANSRSLNVRQRVAKKAALPAFSNAYSLVDALRPSEPAYGFRPHSVHTAARWFLDHFPGRVMYAVKTNPDAQVIHALTQAGIGHFDVASLKEIETVAKHAPKAKIYYMHPVKPAEAIAKAYFEYGVRTFSLDSHVELQKILKATNYAKDLSLFVRLSIPNEHAAMALSGKFGVSMDEAKDLVVETRRVSDRFGICFHVGSQSMASGDYRTAMMLVSDLVEQTGVRLDALDVGGGFPSVYPEMDPPALIDYINAINQSFDDFGFDVDCELFCEPGRALVAEAGSTIVRVDLRKDNMLFINDGIYGSLFDAGFPNFIYPVRALRPDGEFEGTMEAFGFYGPTCDSMDVMKGPFLLPEDIREGDWIEIGQLGAYGTTMRTRFNGFYSEIMAELQDEPMLTMYPDMPRLDINKHVSKRHLRIAKA